MRNAENTSERLLTDAELDAVSGGNPILAGAVLIGSVAGLVIIGWDNGMASMKEQAAALGLSHLKV